LLGAAGVRETGVIVSEPIRHHYIPVFYLKQWTGNDGRLCEYSRPYRKVIAKRKYPRATAYVTGLYSIPQLPEDTQFIEKTVLQKIDHWASQALVSMLQRAPAQALDQQVKIGWSNFIASLLLRMPEHLKISNCSPR
jgi:hypothetical protein